MSFWRIIGWVVIVSSLFMVNSQAATIVGSFHDLVHIDDVHTKNWTSVYNNYGEICVYCHTPHGANENVSVLWNRHLPDSLSYTLYQSSTLSSSPQPPSPVSLLCLSCHDGTIAVDTILNMPSTGVTLGSKHGSMKVPYETVYDCAACHSGWIRDFSGTFLGTDLSNNHPVSIEYSASDPGLKPLPLANGLKLVDNKVECVSCHDVHNPQYRPFLRIPDTGSALCYTCHNK